MSPLWNGCGIPDNCLDVIFQRSLSDYFDRWVSDRMDLASFACTVEGVCAILYTICRSVGVVNRVCLFSQHVGYGWNQ